jgi:hypothetical protein
MKDFQKKNQKTCCQTGRTCLLSALMHRFGAGWRIVFRPMKTNQNEITKTTMQEELIDESK